MSHSTSIQGYTFTQHLKCKHSHVASTPYIVPHYHYNPHTVEREGMDYHWTRTVPSLQLMLEALIDLATAELVKVFADPSDIDGEDDHWKLLKRPSPCK